MNTDLISKLLDLKARQESGEHMRCPRCGNDTMKMRLHTNALSRHADVYICDSCGTNEAMLDFMNNPLPLSEWACFKVKRPPSDLEALGAREATERLNAQQIPYLSELFLRWVDDTENTDFEVYRREAFENCPGLYDLWLNPFRAAFVTRNHVLYARFRKVDGKVQVAIDRVNK